MAIPSNSIDSPLCNRLLLCCAAGPAVLNLRLRKDLGRLDYHGTTTSRARFSAHLKTKDSSASRREEEEVRSAGGDLCFSLLLAPSTSSSAGPVDSGRCPAGTVLFRPNRWTQGLSVAGTMYWPALHCTALLKCDTISTGIHQSTSSYCRS